MTTDTLSSPASGGSLRDEARRTVRHSILMVPFRAWAMGIQFGFSLFFARVFGEAGFGVWGLMLALSQWGYTFFLYWNTAAITRYGTEEYAATGAVRVTFASRTALLLPSLVLLVLVAAGGLDFFAERVHSPRWVVGLILLHALGFSLSETAQYLLPAFGRSDLTSAVLAVERTLALGAVVLLWRAGGLDPTSALAVFAGAAAVSGLVVLGASHRKLLPPVLDRAHLARYWRFCRPALLLAPAGGVVAWIDLFVIDAFNTVAHVGRYFLAFQFYNAVVQMSFIVGTVTGPFTVHLVLKKRPDLEDLFANRIQSLSALGAAALVLAVTPAAWLAFRFAGGADWETTARIWTLLAPGSCAAFLTASLSSYYMAREDTATPAWVAFGAMLLNLALDLALVPSLGPDGAAIAKTVTALAGYIALMTRLKTFGLDPRGVALRSLLCLLPSAIIYASLSKLGPMTGSIVLFVVALVPAAGVVRRTRELLAARRTLGGEP